MRPGSCLGPSSSSLGLGEVDGESVFGERSYAVGGSPEHLYRAVVAKVTGHASHAQLGRWRHHFSSCALRAVRPGFLEKEHGEPPSRRFAKRLRIEAHVISRN
jgi:hypothetical protein